MNFSDLQNVCKYSGLVYDRDKNIIDVCRNPKAKPQGESWNQGEFWNRCDEEHCPLMKVERNDANEMPCSP